MRKLRFSPHFCCAVLLVAAAARAAEPEIDFDRQIRPLLSDRCFHCHGPDEGSNDSELRLDRKDKAFADLGGHRAIVPHKPQESELIARITSTDPDEQMPPPDAARQLSKDDIELLRRWIEQGAKWEQHWSFAPVERPALPRPQHAELANNPLDLFILARLEQEQLSLSPPARRETLLRRVTLDLTGLPPTLAEIDAFLADQSPEAYERVVDRLLASPRYGERMVWEWLDVARYADTNGYQGERTRTMWPWRDWAIAALNRNQPFDQFTIEQLAGDLLPQPSLEQRIATGFHRNHMLNGEGGRIAEESRVDYVIDRVDTTATTWLGLTLGCSRCHDHKFDPFTQRDYYQLSAYFNNVPETGAVDRDGSANPVLEVPTRDQTRQLEQIAARLVELEQQKSALPAEDSAQRAELDKQIQQAGAQREAVLKAAPLVMVMQERPEPRESFVLLRGQWDKHGDKVSPAVITSLYPPSEELPANRLGLAQWLVDPDHPLTARVTVNRQWQMFFGRGLVKTAEDFGAQGERPTHPQLLDWLAAEFISSGWNVKALQRLIVTSAAYRQASQVTPELVERDPENILLARGPRYRWSSAVLRDQALAASGLLVEEMGGPAVKPYQPAGVWEEMSFGNIRYDQDHGAKLYRRGVYTFWRRTVGPTELFDTASRQVCTVRQARTNTPLHALTLLNDPTYVEAARALAEQAEKQAFDAPSKRVAWMFRVVTSRAPTDKELAVLTARLDQLSKHYEAASTAAAELIHCGESEPQVTTSPASLAAHTSIALVLLNLDETLNKE
jgi:mono/diheme cytochrome c family protein